ncbi:alpha/beta fold hydrolase [Kribbella sp. NPDC056345]|uniref:alpha/beta fold hydrolase n=1 Tax=Kribbella sp. NPDC056345 TaxID=3345789 RepID=UPI0035E39B03
MFRRLHRFGGALVALLLVDGLVGACLFRTGTDAEVSVTPARDGRVRRSIVVLPGFVMKGSLVATAFAPYLGPNDAVVAVDYAERGVDPDQIYRQVMDALKRLRPATVVVYGASMGGLVAMEILRRYQYDGVPYGKVVLVLDTAPSGVLDVRRPRWLIDAADWYRGGPVATAAWAGVAGLMGDVPVGAGGNDELIGAAHHAAAWAGTAAMATQGAFIGHHGVDASDAKWSAVVGPAYYFQGEQNATDDPLVDVESGVGGWTAVLPGLVVVPVGGRDGRWHVPLVERPAESAGALLAVLARVEGR